jgi:hypothetical protein
MFENEQTGAKRSDPVRTKGNRSRMMLAREAAGRIRLSFLFVSRRDQRREKVRTFDDLTQV